MSGQLPVYPLPDGGEYETIVRVMRIREGLSGKTSKRQRECFKQSDQRIAYLRQLLGKAIEMDFGVKPFECPVGSPLEDPSHKSTLEFVAPFRVRMPLASKDAIPEVVNTVTGKLMRGLYIGVGEYAITDRAAALCNAIGNTGIFLETVLFEDPGIPANPTLTLLHYKLTQVRVV